jgi:tRNA(Ile)-lysidine synthase
VVGVSGGPDSLCLLRVLKTLSAELALTLTVAHLNHQLREDAAAQDAAFVQHIAAQWNLPLVTETRDIAAIATRRHQSVEEAARQVRYAFLWRVAVNANANKIAVGHNADDQVETILMHFLRGTGLAGLRGMLPATPVAKLRLHQDDVPPDTESGPQIIRPLLEISRHAIETYCWQHHLSPRFDHTNADTTLLRNRLRHQLLPELETYNPNIRQILRRTATVVTAEVELLNDHVEQAWPTLVKEWRDQTGAITRIDFNLPAWRELPLALQRSTLRKAGQTLRRSLRDISFEHIETAVQIAQSGPTGAQVTLPQNLLLTVSYNRLIIANIGGANVFLADTPRLVTPEPVPVNLPGVTPLPHSQWQLKANLLAGESVSPAQVRQVTGWEAYLDAAVVGENPVLRPRLPGDIFCPLGLQGRHKKVNEFMIDQKIPAEQRDSLPLLVTGNKILWVCGYRPDERARLQPGTKQVLHLKFQSMANDSTAL